MKKIALILAVIMIFTVFAGCTKSEQENDMAEATAAPEQEDSSAEDTTAPEQEDDSAEDTAAPEQEDDSKEDTSSKNEMHYAFEFTDVNGKVHKLSDYEGKPVYLEVWGSWCSVCMSSLEHMNEFAGQEHDYYVLSVVFPNHAGEKSESDFIEWYKEFGYDNLIVMLDNDLQIIKDFGITGFPSQIFFDAEGNFAGGQVGQMTTDSIDAVMNKLAQEG